MTVLITLTIIIILTAALVVRITDIKQFRKLIGGTWYKVSYKIDKIDIVEWTQVNENKGKYFRIIKTERW